MGGIIKYRTKGFEASIEKIEVERETKRHVYSKREGRFPKRSIWRSYHDTWIEAHIFLLERAGEEVAGTKKKLDNAQMQLRRIVKLVNDTEG